MVLKVKKHTENADELRISFTPGQIKTVVVTLISFLVFFAQVEYILIKQITRVDNIEKDQTDNQKDAVEWRNSVKKEYNKFDEKNTSDHQMFIGAFYDLGKNIYEYSQYPGGSGIDRNKKNFNR